MLFKQEIIICRRKGAIARKASRIICKEIPSVPQVVDLKSPIIVSSISIPTGRN